jgi:hypothetical protein
MNWFCDVIVVVFDRVDRLGVAVIYNRIGAGLRRLDAVHLDRLYIMGDLAVVRIGRRLRRRIVAVIVRPCRRIVMAMRGRGLIVLMPVRLVIFAHRPCPQPAFRDLAATGIA